MFIIMSYEDYIKTKRAYFLVGLKRSEGLPLAYELSLSKLQEAIHPFGGRIEGNYKKGSMIFDGVYFVSFERKEGKIPKTHEFNSWDFVSSKPFSLETFKGFITKVDFTGCGYIPGYPYPPIVDSSWPRRRYEY